MVTPEPALSVEGLRVSLPQSRGVGDLSIVEDLSLFIRPGEVLGLVGESGAGKSLAAAALIRLLPPPVRCSAGTIRLNGRRIDTLPEAGFRRLRGREIAIIPQDAPGSLNPLETVGYHMREAIRVHREGGRREIEALACDLLAEAHLPDPAGLLAAYPHQLSGGMRQRVAIALALAATPSVLIADEPTTAVDVSTQAHILGLLRRICRERGTAILLISHDLPAMAEIADRLLVLYAGHTVESGPTDAVLERAEHPYTKALIATLPNLSARRRRLTDIPGSMPGPASRPPGCAFNPRCRQAMPICRSQRPALAETGDRMRACWLTADANAGG